ncbi:GIY-YIG nuclease family protein [Microbulbifer sp. CAU 1566]|uniref:GIY-YIG nuclease family protein n=1 Tax=Microbulbifer sp. CAU 1566 TaxID=2933269 RepID=UPI002006BCF0|nr:GIY-YIG nuclease family protein [Microbulbifer sp. CAU 1566]MCK7598216.1 GIY-YIG nuclease family protein [Microbulbifer sp. CAU 1566]
MSDRTCYEDLEFNLPQKLLEELVAVFEDMQVGDLTEDGLKPVQEEQGVYQLFKDGELVYIGKTDSDAGLRKRLQRHSTKVKGRLNLTPEDVKYKAIRLYVFTAVDLEGMLIKYYKDKGHRPAWQHSGFGSNDPGRERDTSKVKDEHFDAMYPADLSLELEITTDDSEISVASLLQQLKDQAPYTIRFLKSGKRPHKDLEDAKISSPLPRDSVDSYLKAAAQALGNEWQITNLPGYVIVYKEDRTYKSGQVITP